MDEKRIIKLAITHGDINGVGYEVILKTLSEPHMLTLCTPIIYGSLKVASYYKKLYNIELPNFNVIQDATDAMPRRINIIDCTSGEVKVELGRPTPEAGKAAYEALARVVEDLKNRQVDALLTAPINKHNIQSANFDFPGHTEFLQSSAAARGQKSLMILCSGNLRVALVTGHIPVSRIATEVTTDLVLEKLRAFNQSLKFDYGIVRPRIAVMALNPHAGDGGVIGDEDDTVIKPALEIAKNQGMLAFGPFPADGFFGANAYKRFDGVLAMYHDQGLAPFKALAMDEGVNFTAGLPFVRTSPAHGTAYDISGQGIASEDSFRQALYMAVDVCRNRDTYRDARRNPLRKQYFDKNGVDEKVNLTTDDESDL